MTELRLRTRRPAPAPRQLTLAEHVELAIDALYQLLPAARDNRRTPGCATNQVLDQVDAVGTYLKRAARGA